MKLNGCLPPWFFFWFCISVIGLTPYNMLYGQQMTRRNVSCTHGNSVVTAFCYYCCCRCPFVHQQNDMTFLFSRFHYNCSMNIFHAKMTTTTTNTKKDSQFRFSRLVLHIQTYSFLSNIHYTIQYIIQK